MERSKKPLSRGLKIFYGVGDCAFSLMTNVESYFFTFFLTNLAQFNLTTVALVTTTASTIDAALSWVYGAILNSVKPMKWGRYRSWLIILPWIVPFLYAFQFMKISDTTTNSLIIIVAAVASHVAWNLPYVANVSLISVAAETPEDRSQLTATRGAWANFSKVIFSYVGVPLATYFAGVVGQVNKYAATAFVLAIVMVIMYFVHFKLFEGYEETGAEELARTHAEQKKMSAGVLAKSLFQNAPLLILLLADLSKWIFNFVMSGIAVYYFTYVAQNPALLPQYILIANVAGIIGSYTSKYFSKKLSTRTSAIMFFVAMTVFLVLAKLLYLTVPVYLTITLLSLAQFGYGANYSLMPALYADCVVYSEWKTGQNAAGWIMGLQNLPLKVGVMTRGIIISACLAAANFSPKIDPKTATLALKSGITNAFMLIPAIATFISVILLIVGFRITKDKVEHYQAEIKARKI